MRHEVCRYLVDGGASAAERETRSEPKGGSGGARFGGVTARATASQGNQATRAACAQNAKGLAASR